MAQPSKTKKASRTSKPKARNVTTKRGDTYIARDVGTKAVVTQGKGNKVTVSIQEGLQSEELATLFDKLYQHIDSLPAAQAADKEEITETVQRMEAEVTEKGEQADETRLQRWMNNINQMAPDIVDVILASLGGPVSAATAVIKKVAERARQQSAA